MDSPPRTAGGSRELLKLSHITLEYGQVAALRDVSLSLSPGQVHAVVGEHGAGKSSLGMVISGNVRPRRGSIDFPTRTFDSLTTQLAHRLGIEMVYQQVQLNDYFSVAENIYFLDRRLARHGFLRHSAIVRRAADLMASWGFTLDPNTAVKDLNLPERVLVSILGALQKAPRLLILDEALEKLSSADLSRVLQVLARRKREGMAVLFITHRIDDVYDFADRVSIVKDGEILMTDDVGEIDRMNLLRLTYTQVYSREETGNRRREFNQFLKYNEAVLLNLPVNLIVVDSLERVKIVNESCKGYFHLESIPFANEPLADLLGPQNGGTLSLIRGALGVKGGRAFYHVPLVIAGADTTSNIRTLPIYDEETLIGNIIIIEDVTEFDKLQRQVILSEKLASVGLLAAGVAHEINNPLEIIYNYLRHIKFSFENPELHRAVDELHEEITYIAGIVRSLLSLASMDQAGRDVVDINELIRGTLGLLRHSAGEKSISLAFAPQDRELPLSVNRGEMKQVILNLVRNSFEAMPAGGAIRIETGAVPNDEGGLSARITFTDTGPGIADPNPGNVFIPFYSTRKGAGDHVGLGLSICYGIVQRHGGSMSVKNLETSGCQFTIQIPLTAAEASGP
ncbi:MAG TPA: ATP-binding cassette domain-containing protein [Spirochaetia bacterium]|nr:ATP-binding cassette domain-containing protein [Spirochaetia bacterium]